MKEVLQLQLRGTIDEMESDKLVESETTKLSRNLGPLFDEALDGLN